MSLIKTYLLEQERKQQELLLRLMTKDHDNSMCYRGVPYTKDKK